MFPNIKAEQSRKGLTNEKTAELIGLCRVSYESKLKSGRFTVAETKKLCEIFGCSFDYLFATDNDTEKTA